MLDKSELNNNSRIRDQFAKLHSREKKNDLCNLEDFCYQFRFQIDKLYIKNLKNFKKKLIRELERFLKRRKQKIFRDHIKLNK